MRTYLLLVAMLLAGCPGPIPPPTPTPAPDSAYCAQMCAHIGPHGLNCPEGAAVYDSALPGDAGVPNESCTTFCTNQEANGVFINPKCVMAVTACSQIEAVRQNTCP